MMLCNSTLDQLPNNEWRVASGIAMAIISLLATIENSVVLVVLMTYPVFRTPSYRIIASLAVADLFTGVMLAPLYTIQLLSNTVVNDCIVDNVRRHLSSTLIGASCFTLTFVSYDRCLHFTRLQTHHMSKQKLYTLLMICWLIPITLPLFRLINDSEYLYSVLIVLLGTVLLVITLLALIGISISLLKYFRNYIRKQHLNKNYTGMSAIMIVITFYLLMLIPLLTHFSLKISNKYKEKFLSKSYVIAMCLAAGNSVINPILYVSRLPVLRVHAKKVFKHILSEKHNPTVVYANDIIVIQNLMVDD